MKLENKHNENDKNIMKMIKHNENDNKDNESYRNIIEMVINKTRKVNGQRDKHKVL